MSVIDDYLKKVRSPQKEELERVRKIIMKAVPEAEDTIGYGMPVLKYKKKYLIGFAPFKDHMSIFPGSGFNKEEVKKFKTSKGTIQFTIDTPLPESLIKKLVLARCKDIDSKT